MKTPEELAEEWISNNASIFTPMRVRDTFIAGYKAAQDQQKEEREELVSENKVALQTLSDQLADADKAMQDISSSATLNNWVGVRDRLPEENGDIVLVSDGDYCTVASYISEDKKFYYFHPCMQRITHWQPLPGLPQPLPSLPRGEK